MLPVALGFFAVFGVGILGIVVLILWVIALIDLSRRPDFDRRHRAAWALIIVLLPIIGTIAYFLARPTLPDEREKIMAARVREPHDNLR